MFNNSPDVVDVAGLCSMLHISKKTAYELLHTNQIEHRKIGRIYRIRKDAVIKFMDSINESH